MKRRAARSGTAGKPGRKTAERQARAAAQQIEQLKKDLSNARRDASSARSDAEAQATQLVAARAQVEQLKSELSQARFSSPTARGETAAHAAQLARAGERIEQRQGEVEQAPYFQEMEQASYFQEVEQAPYFQEEEGSASASLPQRWVKARTRSEQLSNQRQSLKSAAATGTQELRQELEQVLAREPTVQERVVALEESGLIIRKMLDRSTSERTKLQKEIREKDAMLNEAQEHCRLLKAKLERLTAEHSGSPARRQESHAVPKSRRSTQDLEFPSAPAADEQLTEIARRINVEPLLGQARRAAESVEQRRVALSAAAADVEQQFHEWLANLKAQGYRAEADPLVAMKIQELQAEHEFAREQRLRGRHGHAQLLQPGTDLLRVALVWAMQARQLYIHNPPSQRHGHVYWQQDSICLDEESEQDLLRAVTEAFFKWRRKLYR